MINEQLISGIKIQKCNCTNSCEIGLKAKMIRVAFAKTRPKSSKQILELIHTDLCGPMQTETSSGKRYVLTFIDDHSRYTHIYLIKKKSEVTS